MTYYPLNLGIKDPNLSDAIFSIWTTMSNVVAPSGEVVLEHNSTTAKQGGSGDEYYHLSQSAYSYLSNQDQSVVSGASPTFDGSNFTGILDTSISWGTGAGQVSMDDVPNGTTYGKVLATQLSGDKVVKLTDATGNDLEVSLSGADRTLTMAGDVSLDQNLRTTDSPTFSGGHFGDANNYLEISPTGVVSLHNSARVTKRLSAKELFNNGANPATITTIGPMELGVYQFADATDNGISGMIEIPTDIELSSPTFSIKWGSGSSGDCEWQLEYTYFSPDDPMDAAAQGTLTTTTSASTTSNGLVVSEFTLDAPDSSDLLLGFRIKRLAAGANDTISGTVELYSVCLEYTSNKLGA